MSSFRGVLFSPPSRPPRVSVATIPAGQAWDAQALPTAGAASSTGASSGGGGIGSGSPSINLLLDALEQAAAGRNATVELCRRFAASEQASGVDGRGTAAAGWARGSGVGQSSPAAAPALDVGAAAAAYNLCMHSFEGLLAVWLAHAAMDAGLRFEAADIAAFARKASIAAALDASPFSGAVVKQLRVLGT
jgi:hypothetical protein